MKTAHCKALSAAFIECIGSGIIFDMLGRAGQNARIKNGLWLRAEKIYNNYFLKPNAQTLAEVSAIEEELGRADDYVRANGIVISPEILKALDFHNAWGTLKNPTGIRLFDICRRGGEENQCGIYMPATWWWQNPNGAWDFKCELNPSRIQDTDPAAYSKMASEMATIPGCQSDKDWTKLGTRCCGSKFFPWACGASKVMEFD